MKVIAEKGRPNYNNPLIGYVKPIYVFDESAQAFRKVNIGTFPNSGEIFIYSSYNNINENYSEEDFFIIDNVEQNSKDSYDPNTPISGKYIAPYNSIIELLKAEFLLIYYSSFRLTNRKTS